MRKVNRPFVELQFTRLTQTRVKYLTLFRERPRHDGKVLEFAHDGQIDELRGLLSRVQSIMVLLDLRVSDTPSPIAEVGQVPHRARRYIEAWGVTTSCIRNEAPHNSMKVYLQ